MRPTAAILPLMLALATAFPAVAACATAPDPLLSLRRAIERSPDEATLRKKLKRLAPVLGFKLSEQAAREGRISFTLTLAAPVPARRLIEVFQWPRAYAISGDVHQLSWELSLSSGDIDDRYGPRIGAYDPHVGAWAVSPSLDDRPPGDLPALVCGPSPAYDLTVYPANVTGLTIELWSAGWQSSATMELPPTKTAPLSSLNRALLKAWFEDHKGLGAPRYFDSSQSDMRVFAVWNIPTSGLNVTDFWVYCLQEEWAGWNLLVSSRFTPPEDQAHTAEIDPERHELRFLGRDGTVYHRVSVAGCVWTEP
jgi:hypothetical protein